LKDRATCHDDHVDHCDGCACVFWAAVFAAYREDEYLCAGEESKDKEEDE